MEKTLDSMIDDAEISVLRIENADLRTENARLRDALERIATETKKEQGQWPPYPMIDVLLDGNDCREIAKASLKGGG